MNPSLFYGKTKAITRPVGGDKGDSDDSCLSESDDSDSDYVPCEDDSEDEDSTHSDTGESLFISNCRVFGCKTCAKSRIHLTKILQPLQIRETGPGNKLSILLHSISQYGNSLSFQIRLLSYQQRN